MAKKYDQDFKKRALRMLAETHATRGDARRISDRFGLSIEGTNRYIDTLEYPDLTASDDHTRSDPGLGSQANTG